MENDRNSGNIQHHLMAKPSEIEIENQKLLRANQLLVKKSEVLGGELNAYKKRNGELAKDLKKIVNALEQPIGSGNKDLGEQTPSSSQSMSTPSTVQLVDHGNATGMQAVIDELQVRQVEKMAQEIIEKMTVKGVKCLVKRLMESVKSSEGNLYEVQRPSEPMIVTLPPANDHDLSSVGNGSVAAGIDENMNHGDLDANDVTENIDATSPPPPPSSSLSSAPVPDGASQSLTESPIQSTSNAAYEATNDETSSNHGDNGAVPVKVSPSQSIFDTPTSFATKRRRRQSVFTESNDDFKRLTRSKAKGIAQSQSNVTTDEGAGKGTPPTKTVHFNLPPKSKAKAHPKSPSTPRGIPNRRRSMAY